MQVTQKMLNNMVDTFNKYHQVMMNGTFHKLIIERNINGLGLAWMDTTKHTISANVSPSTAMSNWETYLVIKTITDNQIYAEQSKLTIVRA